MNEGLPLELCNCHALRRASRHLTQLYDRHLAPHGLTVSQYALVARLVRCGPRSIHVLAHELLMDRTTLARNLKPLERDGLISLEIDANDRRSKTVDVTELGRSIIRRAQPAWEAAQRHFEVAFGSARATQLRTLLQAVAECELVDPQPD